jgi:hypothetical protein
MAFKAFFFAHAPDADPVKHHNLIETGRYKIYTCVAKTQDEAIKVAKIFIKKKN